MPLYSTAAAKPTTRVVTGTTDTLLATDDGNVVTYNNASAIAVTVPSGLGANYSVTCIQLGAGQVSFTPSSTTLNSYGGLLKISGQHGSATLFAYTADTFNVCGTLTA